MDGFDIQVEALAPARVVSFHSVSESPEIDSWQKLRSWAEAAGLSIDCGVHTIYGFNNPNPTEGKNEYGYELWIAVGPEIESGGEVVFKDFPGGPYAVARDVKITEMARAYRAVMQWVQSSGQYKWRESNELEKIHDPDADEEDTRFDIYVPVEEK